MQEEKKKKFPLTIFEVALLIIVIPILFYYTGKLLWEPMNKHAPNWFFNFWGLLLVLGFNFAWIIMMKLWSFKNLRIKIYASLFIFTVSAVILTCWVLLNLFSGTC